MHRSDAGIFLYDSYLDIMQIRARGYLPPFPPGDSQWDHRELESSAQMAQEKLLEALWCVRQIKLPRHRNGKVCRRACRPP